MPSHRPFEWIEIPAGKVILITQNHWADNYVPKGKAGKTFDVPVFAIAKYPTTNAQYRKFIEADGYQNKQWWTQEGWQLREEKQWIEPRYWQDKHWSSNDEPVVGVSWFEARAFCQWLSEVSNTKVILPTEQQWQRAAQGDDGRAYSWGDEWDCTRCNNSVSPCESHQTTPVTAYEQTNISPFGVVDMVGNVWEWCNTVYETGKQDYVSVSSRCVLRGGSWNENYADDFCVSRRLRDLPGDRFNDWGFRCVRVE